MIELRLLFVVGMLATAVLAYVLAVGAFTATRWLYRLGQRALRQQALVRWRPDPSPETERRMRARQAAWRLRC